MFVAKSSEIFNNHKSKYLIVTFTPVFAVLDNLACLANYFLSNIIVKLNTFVDLFVKLSKKLHLYDAKIIFLELDVGSKLICLSEILDLLNILKMDNLLVHQVGTLVQALL